VGPAYFSYYRLLHSKESDLFQKINEEEEEEQEDVQESESDLRYLKSLDPKNCKVSM